MAAAALAEADTSTACHGAFALPVARRRLLLVQLVDRAARFGGCWTAAGGRAEPGETELETAEREMLEETGAKFVPDDPDDPFLDFLDDQGRRIVMFLGTADPCTELECQASEIKAAAWITSEQARELPLAFNLDAIVAELSAQDIID